MKLPALRRYRVVVALFGAVALIAACSGSPVSNPLSPTGARTTAQSAAATDFNPFPETDPCLATSGAGFETNPEDTPECEEGTGRFTGGGFQINAQGVRVTRGFTLHCDVLLSNNFEVNWPEANNFHIDKLGQSATCQFINDPNPPDAPVNRIRLEGTGKLNGVPGATVLLILIDNGEKTGAPPDQAFIAINGVVIAGSGTPAAPVPTDIDGGNIQAHFDQPHKN